MFQMKSLNIYHIRRILHSAISSGSLPPSNIRVNLNFARPPYCYFALNALNEGEVNNFGITYYVSVLVLMGLVSHPSHKFSCRHVSIICGRKLKV
jgi:hypothetical protein